MSMGMVIKIFTTGGSIDKTYDTAASDFVVGPPQIETVLREANTGLHFAVESLLQKDSLALTDEDRALIVQRVQREPARHIIITHGTDTMTQTAAGLALLRDKVIVLTGAMQPAAFKKTDAAFNIGGAVAAVQLLPPGVYIAMSGHIFPWDQTRKNPSRDQFEWV
ncbi:MAG: asparaginase [Anaerolineae bacterium]|jgi:L-asparaginase|nr:asparaginase [Anaerolineae bacterium]